MHEALRIVVVDDDPSVRAITIEVLRLEGHQVIDFGNPIDALDYLRENPADMLFTDLSMPEMTGVQLIDIILSEGILPHDRIVAVTGLAFESPDVHWLTARKILVLFKPFSLDAIRWSLDPLRTPA